MALTKRPRLAVAAIIGDGQGRCLLVQRIDPPAVGTWAFPGGSLEWGESIAEGVAREVREECGLTIQAGDVLYLAELLPRGDDAQKDHFVILDLAGLWTAGEPEAGSDAGRLLWVDAAGWRQLALAPGMRDALQHGAVRRFLGWA
jgi:8-oxo-dGTP diphosphatase